MWAVYKIELYGNPETKQFWYVGFRGEWSGTSDRAARWPDKRDAEYVARYIRSADTETHVGWVEHMADRTQVVYARELTDAKWLSIGQAVIS